MGDLRLRETVIEEFFHRYFMNRDVEGAGKAGGVEKSQILTLVGTVHNNFRGLSSSGFWAPSTVQAGRGTVTAIPFQQKKKKKKKSYSVPVGPPPQARIRLRGICRRLPQQGKGVTETFGN